MEYGHVCFAYTKKKWIAKAIAWFTKSKWSHSFITIPPILDKEMVMEASEGGVQTVMFDPAYRNNDLQSYEIYRFKIDQLAKDSAILRCMDDLETMYGFLEYPWFIWRSLNRWLGRDIKNQDNWCAQGTVCSGLVRLYIESSGLKNLFKDYGIDSANAQDIYEIVLANPDLFEIVEKKD